MADWIECGVSLPCFICFGFPTGRTIRWKLADGSEHSGPYEGYGIFGGVSEGVTHWRPSESDVHLHQMHNAHSATGESNG